MWLAINVFKTLPPSEQFTILDSILSTILSIFEFTGLLNNATSTKLSLYSILDDPEKFATEQLNWALDCLQFLIYELLIISIKLLIVYDATNLMTYGLKDSQLYFSRITWGSLFMEMAFPDVMTIILGIWYGCAFMAWLTNNY